MERNSSSIMSRFITSGEWTNEKHLHYLNSMESSFVHAMFENNNGRLLLPLDRYIPDASDSTLDLKTHSRSNKHASTTSADDIIGGKIGIDRRAEKRLTRRHSYHQPYTSLQDQVVPQIRKRRGDKEEEGDHPFDAPTK